MNCYLNGKTMPLAEAAVSVMDRGFLFGDGVYEVTPIYRRRPFCWDRHLRRLQENLARIALPFDVGELLAPCKNLIAAAADDSQSLYIQLTRGAYSQRTHKFPPRPKATVFAVSWNRAPPPATKREKGVCCALAEDIRWARCDIKSTSLLGAVMLANPENNGETEETLLHRDGAVCEGASTNIIIVAGGRLITPPLDNRVLPGITCRAILETAEKLGHAVTRRDIPLREMLAADEVWLTSSTRELLPVVAVGGQKIADGKPGAVFWRVFEAFQKNIDGYCGFQLNGFPAHNGFPA